MDDDRTMTSSLQADSARTLAVQSLYIIMFNVIPSPCYLLSLLRRQSLDGRVHYEYDLTLRHGATLVTVTLSDCHSDNV